MTGRAHIRVMYIESVPNRNSPPAILLRESYREGGKVRKRTLCNLSDWEPAHIEGLRAVLKGGIVIPAGQEAIRIDRSLPHGHVAAALGTARRIGLDRLLGPDDNRCRDLVLALVVSRILDPTSKLAAARALAPATATSSLGDVLGLGAVDEDELYTALDWLHERQPAIENALAKRHLQSGTLVLYDVSSSYLEGRCCPLAMHGYSRDGKRGKRQIVYGLLCAPDGCPVAIEVFAGNTADPATLGTQVGKLKQRFGLDYVVLVGDRGMITQARISEDIQPAGLDWITALRGPAIQELLASGALQLSLFDERDMASITAPAYPGERLVICRNPDLAAERLDDAATVRSYKSLARVERAFRCLKSVDLQIRPIHHWLAERVRAHVFLCMLAYYLEWHMRRALAPMLYEEGDRKGAEALRPSPVAKAQRSEAAVRKQTTGQTAEGLPVHSFHSLIADLATLARNTVTTALAPNLPFTIITRPTPVQQQAFELLGLSCSQ